ncbi:MAG: polysaccharide biosynthesis PFTS motif protein [Desulfobacterales bacterium]|nr:polysaccharide biosynthesis PFTS motif protein [Desulfobacterales bacterium]
MANNYFTRFVKRRGCRRLRRIMRGYRFLKKSKSLNRISDINRALTSQPLDIKEKQLSKFIFGKGIEQAKLVCRQYLLIRVAGRNLNRAMLYALGKQGSSVFYHLPTEWREILKNNGFKVETLRTALLWNVFVGIMMAYGVLTIAKIIISGIWSLHNQSTKKLGSYVYFDNLGPGNLPQPCRDGCSHDIISWYMQWTERVSNLDTICHGVICADHKVVNGTPVVPNPAPFPPLAQFGLIARFIIWSLGAILIATWDYLRGRWWHALLLNQAALAAQVRMQSPKLLAKEYLFHNSGWIYRPLWSYEAERLGSRITFYFYSTNCDDFKRTDGYPPPSYGLKAMNWPHYLVWDAYQADFVRRAVGKTASISIVGPIWFNTSAKEMPVFSGKGVAVFDVTPHRSSKYQTLGADFDLYIPEICIPFLQDIQQVTQDDGYLMLWKRKRQIGSFAHRQYRFFEERISKAKNVIIIDPGISAYRVIEASTFVISMPFTSTALIARQLDKPSCYYDPTGMIQKDDRAAHGIVIIRGLEELKKWLKTISVISNITGATGRL